MKHSTHLQIFIGICFLCLIFFLSGCSDEIESSNAEQLLEQAYSFAHDGRWEDALKFSAQAYKLRPDNTTVRLMQALALKNNGRENDALEVSRIAAEDEKSFLAQYNYGYMLFQEKRYDQAQIYLKRALELKKDDFNTLILLQQSSARLEQHSANQNYCRELMRLYGSRHGKDFNAYIYNELALNILNGMPKNTARTRGKLEKIFELAAKATPSSPELEWNRAVFYDYYLNDFASAKKHYERFLQLTEKYSGMEKERAAVNERLYKSGNR